MNPADAHDWADIDPVIAELSITDAPFTSDTLPVLRPGMSFEELHAVALCFDDLVEVGHKEFCAVARDWAGDDYDNQSRAVALCAVAGAVLGAGPKGLQGLQHRAVVGHFARVWEGTDSPIVMRYVEAMLWPENAHLFKTELSAKSVAYLTARAEAVLEAEKARSVKALPPNTAVHLRNIVNGSLPFGWKKEKDE